MTAPPRYDRTVRTVMWLDAFLSVGIVVLGIVVSPVLATVGVPGGVLPWVGLAVAICAVLLAAFGAVTAVLLMLRMQAGHYLLPPRLRLAVAEADASAAAVDGDNHGVTDGVSSDPEWTTLRGKKRWYQRLSAQDLAETQVRAPDGTEYRIRVSSNAPIVGPSTAATLAGSDSRSVGDFLKVNGALGGNTGWTITVLDVPRRLRSQRVLYSQFVGAKAIVPDVTIAIADALTRGDLLWD